MAQPSIANLTVSYRLHHRITPPRPQVRDYAALPTFRPPLFINRRHPKYGPCALRRLEERAREDVAFLGA